MYTLNSWKNIEIVLDASGIDESSKWFLVQDIPQYNGGVKLVDWHGLEKNNSVVSFVNGDKIEKHCIFDILQMNCSHRVCM
jgi:hypothetical protein